MWSCSLLAKKEIGDMIHYSYFPTRLQYISFSGEEQGTPTKGEARQTPNIIEI